MMNHIKTTLLLSPLTVLMVHMGSAIGGKAGMIFAFFMATAMNFFSYWFSDKIVLKMYGAREINRHDHPSFYNMVEHLAHNASLPMPKVSVIPSANPNAFATGRNPAHAAVAATLLAVTGSSRSFPRTHRWRNESRASSRWHPVVRTDY